MKALEISKDSWHYKVSQWFDPFDTENLCSYVWRVIFNVLKALYVAAGTLVLLWSGIFPWFLIVVVFLGHTVPTMMMILGAVFLTFQGIFLAAIWSDVSYYLQKWYFKKKHPEKSFSQHWYEKEYLKAKKREEKGEPFLRMMWKTLKEKTCYRVEVK